MKNYIKIAVVGDTKVGKSSLINTFINEKYTEADKITIGADFKTKDLQINGTAYTLQITEIGGENQFLQLLDLFLKGVEGVLLLYDPGNYKTFVNLTWWIQILKKHDSNMKIFLIATKSDKLDNKGAIKIKLEGITKKFKLNGYEIVSIMEEEIVKTAFANCVNLIIQSRS
ncbi:MAG: GTP-binding protein [Promethearchaeota archaeon]